MKDEKYHHNVLMIWWNRIELTPKGVEYVEEARKTLLQKAGEIAKRTGIDIAVAVKEEVKDLMAKAIAEYFKAQM